MAFVEIKYKEDVVIQKICQTFYYGLVGALISLIIRGLLKEFGIPIDQEESILKDGFLIISFIVTEFFVVLSVWKWNVFIWGDTSKLPHFR